MNRFVSFQWMTELDSTTINATAPSIRIDSRTSKKKKEKSSNYQLWMNQYFNFESVPHNITPRTCV